MTTAYLRSAALAPFGHTPERSLEELAHPPIMTALRDAGLEPAAIDAVIGGSYASGTLTAQRAIRGLGLSERPVLNVENACASSSAAAALAATALAATSAAAGAGTAVAARTGAKAAAAAR